MYYLLWIGCWWYVGSKGMGALIYEPEITGVDPKKNLDLDEIADETISLQKE